MPGRLPGRRNHTKGGREKIQGNQGMFAICVSKNTEKNIIQKPSILVKTRPRFCLSVLRPGLKYEDPSFL